MACPQFASLILTTWRARRYMMDFGFLQARLYGGVVIGVSDKSNGKLVGMAKVDTSVMPVDFLTKWLKAEKVEQQLAYLINSRHAVWPT